MLRLLWAVISETPDKDKNACEIGGQDAGDCMDDDENRLWI